MGDPPGATAVTEGTAPAGASPDDVIPAGGFATWVAGATIAIRGEGTSDVPCGSCTACCRSGQFVHIAPDEVDTLAHIPRALLFPAPLAPRGHVLLGYDAQGRCPMLTDAGCSIYEHRPRACRTYDCRVFAASGITTDKPLVGERVARWRFDVETEDDAARLAAVQAAAAYLSSHEADLSDVPANPTQRAALAVELHELFLGHDSEGLVSVCEPALDDVRRTVAELMAPATAAPVTPRHSPSHRGR